MKTRMVRKLSFSLFAVLLAASFVLSGCDMQYVHKPVPPGSGSAWTPPGTGSTPADPIAEMERNGRYLRLYNLPADTLKESITDVRITDGVSQIARVENYGNILIGKDSTHCNAYIPLLAQSGAEFIRTGSFYVEFTVRIDALTRIVVRPQHNVLVEFEEGRGSLDIAKLITQIGDVVDAQTDPVVEREIDAIIAGGGYVRFFNLPPSWTSLSTLQWALPPNARTTPRLKSSPFQEEAPQ